LVTIIPDR